MSIEAYFSQIQQLINNSGAATLVDVTYSNQGEEAGYIRGNIIFRDDSVLHFREYVDAEFGTERLMYSYHYMDSSKNLVFRYDNADHHHELALSSHPHHKHDGSEENIVESTAPTLADVLGEIELLVRIG
ncbi:hypothetical protein KFU94_57460 [Chloroflexi bacterium TSY]|nr:hypothetical protein [Chloroflexi bacterium TSY]